MRARGAASARSLARKYRQAAHSGKVRPTRQGAAAACVGRHLARVVGAALEHGEVVEVALVLVLQHLLGGEQVGRARLARQRHRDPALPRPGRGLDDHDLAAVGERVARGVDHLALAGAVAGVGEGGRGPARTGHASMGRAAARGRPGRDPVAVGAARASAGDPATTPTAGPAGAGRDVRWCRGGDLNPYDLLVTSPSSWRVYLFRHLGASVAPSPARGRRGRPEVYHAGPGRQGRSGDTMPRHDPAPLPPHPGGAAPPPARPDAAGRGRPQAAQPQRDAADGRRGRRRPRARHPPDGRRATFNATSASAEKLGRTRRPCLARRRAGGGPRPGHAGVRRPLRAGRRRLPRGRLRGPDLRAVRQRARRRQRGRGGGGRRAHRHPHAGDGAVAQRVGRQRAGHVRGAAAAAGRGCLRRRRA